MSRRAAIALAIDVVLVVAFVAIGRRNHHEDEGLSGLISVSAPFLIGLAIGWGATWRRHAPFELSTGAQLWACTVVVGLVLRRTVFDRGIALAFIIVATITLCVFLIGWRAIARAVFTTSEPPGRE
ncbi:MAG: rane protein [Acidimicrobiales bacterium]|jgi:ribose/xylose/arabinose/galactoside ABC-type transport system permease subunit|nr:rane protein [Acidimicrobiales bacterium]